MRVLIELDDAYDNVEVIIKTNKVDESIIELQRMIQKQTNFNISFYKEDREYFLSLKDILFFETENGHVFAHTKDNAYEVKYKLYEMEERLPNNFLRVSKSTIVNSRHIYALDYVYGSASQIRFLNTHKNTYVSRRYYKMLKERLNQRRN